MIKINITENDIKLLETIGKFFEEEYNPCKERYCDCTQCKLFRLINRIKREKNKL